MTKFLDMLNRRADRVDDVSSGEDGGATLLLLILFLLFLPFYAYWRLLKLPWRTSLTASILLFICGLALRARFDNEWAQLLTFAFGVLAGVVLIVFNVLRGLYDPLAGAFRHQ